MKREKEVECKVELSYDEQDIQKMCNINYLTRLNIVCFPKQINLSFNFNLGTDLQIMLSNGEVLASQCTSGNQ